MKKERIKKVIFLDFDGVLNSAASFVYEGRVRDKHPDSNLPPVNQTLCRVCTSNFQYVLDTVKDANIVISSTWRELFDLEWLKKKLDEYGIDSFRVIDRTPSSWRTRGYEINEWLEDHPEVKHYVIIDDNHIGDRFTEKEIVKTSWNVGMTLEHSLEAIRKLGTAHIGLDLHLEYPEPKQEDEFGDE